MTSRHGSVRVAGLLFTAGASFSMLGECGPGDCNPPCVRQLDARRTECPSVGALRDVMRAVAEVLNRTPSVQGGVFPTARRHKGTVSIVLKRSLSVVLVLWALVVGWSLWWTSEADSGPEWQLFGAIVSAASVIAGFVMVLVLTIPYLTETEGMGFRERWSEDWRLPGVGWGWYPTIPGTVCAMVSVLVAMGIYDDSSGNSEVPGLAAAVGVLAFFIVGLFRLVRRDLFGLVWLVAAGGLVEFIFNLEPPSS